MDRSVVSADDEKTYDRLHEAVRTYPESVWNDLRAFLCAPTNNPQATSRVDLVEDLMFWHADAFVDRLEALLEECPSARETVAAAYVGGVAAEGVDRFHALQERLFAAMQDRSGPSGSP